MQKPSFSTAATVFRLRRQKLGFLDAKPGCVGCAETQFLNGGYSLSVASAETGFHWMRKPSCIGCAETQFLNGGYSLSVASAETGFHWMRKPSCIGCAETQFLNGGYSLSVASAETGFLGCGNPVASAV